jgi:cytoskeletal protein RodZ
MREAKGLTLDQINARTRISLRVLDALEADNTSLISSPFLYRSFVRQFAAAVEADFNALSPGVQQLAESMPQPLIPGQGEANFPNVPPLKVGPRAKVKWLTSFATLGAMIVACSGVYAAWQSFRDNSSDSLAFLVNPFTRQALAAGTLPKPAVRSAISSPALPLQTPDRTLVIPHLSDVETGFTIELSAVERTWLSIVADGRQSFTGTLESDETKVLAGHDTARIRTGNAGGVSVVFNGRPIGPLGPRGQIRTVLFTRDRYQVLESTNRTALMPARWNVEGLQLLRPASLSQTF